MSDTKKGGFSAPPTEDHGKAGTEDPKTTPGAATVPHNVGHITKDKLTKHVKKTSEGQRTIKVKATQKGWFDCKRIIPEQKFMVSEQEFSELWMEKI